MPSRCLFAVLVVALFLSYNISIAIAGFSSGRSGGRMGGSSFRPRPTSFSSKHKSRTYVSSSSSRGLDKAEGSSDSISISPSGFLIFLGTLILAIGGYLYLTEPWYEASVLMVQVGLSGKARLLLENLSQIAESADTSDVQGFHHVLKETVSVLLQHRDYWLSGFTYVEKKDSVTASEKSFNQHSLEERKKVDIESLVNFNGELKRISTQKGNELETNYIVVTILLAVRGVKNLPSVKTAENLKTSLESLRLVSLDDTMAVEVLWTPQDWKDMLSEDDLLENYHHLKPI